MKSKHDKHWRGEFCDLKRRSWAEEKKQYLEKYLDVGIPAAYNASFLVFVHPTQEPDLLRGLDRSLTKMHTWPRPMRVIQPDAKALLILVEACSG